jgi:hypothetical protein
MPATFDDSATVCAVCGVNVDDGGLCAVCNPCFSDFPALAALESAAADDYRLRAAAGDFAAALAAMSAASE